MPTKTTTKTAARKPATARKPVKAAAPLSRQRPKAAPRADKRQGAANQLRQPEPRALRRKPPAKQRATPQSACAPITANAASKLPQPANRAKEAGHGNRFVDRREEAAAETRGRRRRAPSAPFLPPISRIRATPEPPPGPVAAPVAPRRRLRRPSQRLKSLTPDRRQPPAEPEGEPQKIIHIKPPIIVKDLAQQLGLKNFQLIKELMDDFNIFANPNQTVEPDVATKICEKHGFVFEMERREKGGGVHKVEQVVVAPPPPVIEKEEELKTRGADHHFHGSRRSRQDVAHGRDPQDARRGGRSRRDHAAHRRLHRRLQRHAHHFSRHARATPLSPRCARAARM